MNFHQKPVTYVGEVGLKVMDLEGMVQFYTETIGFELLSKSDAKAALGVQGKTLLNLETFEGVEPKTGRYAGLYHFAILLPSRKELGKILIHLHNNGIRLGSSDHLVSEALYLSDPEGNGIEIYRDREPEQWDWDGKEVKMAVDPLDAQGVVQAAADSGEAWMGMPADTVMGHIHLHISNMAETQKFYVDGLGFEVLTSMGAQAMFLGDQKYHHHIGVNVWNGVGIPALPEKTAGLHYYTLVMADEAKQAEVAERLHQLGAKVEDRGDYMETQDPAGNWIRLVV
ncbi:Catechol-2,3-dioxygenase [Planococcus massiliensis]|uniref:Catechol-2,3-dioxygenase n=1 Tax=Planococcus massiliensis TaxID=1499687 RepID=A0A098EQN6_9BACL|nr:MULTISPECIES: VOC family protein [Planococcus]MCJ1909554.1 VOC family protein [Planococcus ruber]CEG24117.1 Catechol-2,3-dioxygenase [Planococcus massiliensis]